MLRTHTAGSLSTQDVGSKVTLAGWIARRRDHGGVAFIDVRDSSGSVQAVIHDENLSGSLRAEWCILLTGTVSARPAGNENLQSQRVPLRLSAKTSRYLAKLRRYHSRSIVET